MFAAIACGIANNRQCPRSHNIKRVFCQSNEKCETYLRLKEEDVKELTLEYMGWRLETRRRASQFEILQCGEKNGSVSAVSG